MPVKGAETTTTNLPQCIQRMHSEYQNLELAYLQLQQFTERVLTELIQWRKDRASEDGSEFVDSPEWNLLEDRAKFLMREFKSMSSPIGNDAESDKDYRAALENGRRLRTIRLKNDLSIEKVSKLLGIPAYQVIAGELGMRSVNVLLLEKLIEYNQRQLT